jgi:hypothetical protein
MEVTVDDMISKLQKAHDEIPNVVKKAIESTNRLEVSDPLKITELNLKNIQNKENSNGGELVNSNKVFSGRYSRLTAQISEEGTNKPLRPKLAGQNYNFVWGGLFRNRFIVKVNNNILTVYNTGMDTNPLKKNFFDGYKNLLGFQTDDMDFINNELIKKEICDYLKKLI